VLGTYLCLDHADSLRSKGEDQVLDVEVAGAEHLKGKGKGQSRSAEMRGRRLAGLTFLSMSCLMTYSAMNVPVRPTPPLQCTTRGFSASAS
jgi:hypothetical protein